MIHVCSLARLHDTVAETGASHIVTLLRLIDRVQRPTTIAEANHLILGMDDISMPMDGYTHPAEEHVHDLIRFVQRWDRRAPLESALLPGPPDSPDKASGIESATPRPRPRLRLSP